MGQYNKPQTDPSFPASGEPRASDLANQVGETRSAITSDIKELGEKLSPSQLKQEAKNVGNALANGAKEVVVDKAIEVKDAIVEKSAEVADAAGEKLAEAKEVVSEAIDDAGEAAARIGRATWRFTSANAVPLALLGIGAGWMIANSRRSPDPRMGSVTPARRAAMHRPYEERALQWDEMDERDEFTSTGSGNGSRTKKTAGQRALRSGERALARIESSGSDLIERGKQTATRGARRARQSLVRAKDASLDFADANPLALAMGTLALGVGVGLLLPTTEREEKWLAPTRQKFDRLMGEAREAASDVVDMAKETASESLSRS